jgi:O-antigen/teichoic acid export membrane protein
VTLDTPEAPAPPVAEPESKRVTTARGTLINSGFTVGFQTLGLLKGLIIAGFLTTTEYGIWGLLVISLGTLTWLKDIGIAEKYVQQEDEDQRAAYEKAFTVDLIANVALVVLIVATLPLFALAYGQWEIFAPGLVIAAVLPFQSLKTPTWVYYRQMQFTRQRVLESVDPLVAFVVTVGLAIAGVGVWSLVIGFCAGLLAAAGVAVAMAPYRPRLNIDRSTMREYVSFSWPILVAALSGLLIPQLSMIVGTRELGLAGAGMITLAGTVGTYTDKVDEMITWSLYPAICRVKDRTELLFEAFVKSNRLALMWGVPFGIAIALFAPDLVHYGIGDQWEEAIGLLQVFGVIAAAHHIGFNWTSFFSAKGNTRPMAVAGPIAFAAFLVFVVPLTLTLGLDGFAIGMAAMTAVNLIVRGFFLRRLFPGFRMLRHMARAIAPTIPAAAIVLLVRFAEPERTFAIAASEVALYIAVTSIATWAFERSLLREVLDYVRGKPGSRLAPA